MALTPEDVINKRFQPTKFREGYDQDEVDDFLDEIVLELRNLNQEIAGLTQQLEAAGEQPARTQETAAESSTADEAAPAAESTPVEEPVQAAAAAEPAQPAESDASQQAVGLVAMAQKLHDDYVATGRAEHDRLVAEGQSNAERMVSDAQRSKDEVLAGLEQERGTLEQKVNDLKGFEARYRESLKEFISRQLHDIETAPAVISETDQA
ncbi:DivIVA domain-containing protein [Kocuria sp.]|uniref:DivIVA domain-containing protein n=1 Tax=Kocuria sp. TaxID=1871328 RepID=UPI0026DFED91|nr:DivIVA domain-containing protein [Kocuria sp.]MDO5618443.1 DivIVA domain-containing protein [Kocuria sp.]